MINIINSDLYLARDYNDILKWVKTYSQYLTKEWTDFTISEPDTLVLNQIAFTYDLLNYSIDSKYINTLFKVTNDTKFLSILNKLTSNEFSDYISSGIKVKISNLDPERELVVNKYDTIVDNKGSVYSIVSKGDIVPPEFSKEFTIVKGVAILKLISKEDLFNAGSYSLSEEFIVKDSVGVIIDGDNLLSKLDNSLLSSDQGFSVISMGDNKLSIKLSPRSYESLSDNSKIYIKYIVDSGQLISNNKVLTLMNKDVMSSIEVLESQNVSESSIDNNYIKYNYIDNLNKVNILYNDPGDLARVLGEDLLSEYGVSYISSRYLKYDNFISGKIDYNIKKATIKLNSIPHSVALVRYNYLKYTEDTKFTHSFNIVINSTSEVIELGNDPYERIIPGSISISYDDVLIVDNSTDGSLSNISNKSTLDILYELGEGGSLKSPVNLFTSFIDYDNNKLEINFDWLYDDYCIYDISYLVINNDEDPVNKSTSIVFSDLNNTIDLIGEGNIVKGSLVISNNMGDILMDNGSNRLIITSSREIKFLSRIRENLLLDKEVYSQLTELNLVHYSIEGTIFLDTSEDYTDQSILSDIDSYLRSELNVDSGVSILDSKIISLISSRISGKIYSINLTSPNNLYIDDSSRAKLDNINLSIKRYNKEIGNE